MCRGIQFTSEEKRVFKYYAIIMGFALSALLITTFITGCSLTKSDSSTNIPRQQKFVVYSYEEAVEVGTLAKKLVADGTIKEPNATRIEVLYDRLIDAQVIYAQALLKYQENMGDKGAVTALNVAWLSVASKATEFVNEAIKLGVNWRRK